MLEQKKIIKLTLKFLNIGVSWMLSMQEKLVLNLSDEIDDLDEVQINAWICGDKLLRAVINPFTPYRIPYHAFPYERNPYNFFGIGIAENMDDSQQIMNGHARMAIDNLAMSGSLVFDVDESALVGGQSHGNISG